MATEVSRRTWLQLGKIAKRIFWISLGSCMLLPVLISVVPTAVWKSSLFSIWGFVFFVGLLALLAWLAAGIASWWFKGPIRWGIFAPKVRRAHLLSVFDRALHASDKRGLHLVRVLQVYQVARKGTKCVIEHARGGTQDAWFWSFRPRRGSVLIVRSSSGYGLHTNRAHVMYVGSRNTGHGVLECIPASAWRAAIKRTRQQ